MRIIFCAVFLHCFSLRALSVSFEAEKNVSTQDVSTEPIPESINIKALLDYESGLVFYKDTSISACLVEKIPESIFEISEATSSPTFKLPIPSEEVCVGRDAEIFKTEPMLVSEAGLLFCNGLPILDINKLKAVDEKPLHKPAHKSLLSRRRRQTNGYYRTHAPRGEARAHSGWNPGQASQAQVQGQVFGSGFFSGQAQSQNTGMSQSQVQLSGVGVRGQIASSSGNAQAQLSLDNGAGSGQASGLGEGPSTSQVQVNLGQQGEQSMASASATSGGARAGIGGAPGAGALGSFVGGSEGGMHGITGQSDGFGAPGYGYTPGSRLFESVGPGASQAYGNGVPQGQRGGQMSEHTHQTANGHSGYGYIEQPVGLNAAQGGAHGVSGVGEIPTSSNGIRDSHFSPNAVRGRNGVNGGTYGIGSRTDQGSPLGTISPGGHRTAAGVDGLQNGLGSPGSSVSGRGYEQGSSVYGNRLGSQQVSGANGQKPVSPDASSSYGQNLQGASQFPSQTTGSVISNGQNLQGASQFPSQTTGSVISNGQVPDGAYRSSLGQPGQIGSGGSYYNAGGIPGQIARGTGGSLGGNGHYVTPAHGAGRSALNEAGFPGGNFGLGGRGSEPNGRAYYGEGGAAGRPYSQGSTPGAYAATYGLGQAQAQTVYFGNAGNGQYIPLRYDQSSQPGGTPGIHRQQDQQVGIGTAGQRQQLSQNGGSSGTGIPRSTIRTQDNGVGVANGHRQNILRNGHTPQGYGNGVAISPNTVQQPLTNGHGLLPTTGIQSRPGVATGLSGAPGFAPHSSGLGSSGGGSGYRPSQTSLGRQSPGLGDRHPSTGYANEIGRGQGLPQTQTLPSGHLPSSTTFQNGHTQTYPTNIRNGQTHTNGYSNVDYGQQQIPSTVARNGYPSRGRINGNGHSSQGSSGQQAGQASIPGIHTTTTTGDTAQDGFSPSYGISRPSQDDPEGRKCTIITFSCTIVVESNGRAKICKPNAVKMGGNGNSSGGNGSSGSGSNICCC